MAEAQARDADDGERNTGTQVAVFEKPRLPWHPAIGDRLGIPIGQWKVLVEATWPSAKTADAVILALNYCKARNLDPMKKPVHIVPMYDSKKKDYVETIWPSISELRTTAFRTRQYAGADETEFGPTIKRKFSGKVKEWENNSSRYVEKIIEVEFPEWARITVYRLVEGQRCKFVGPRVKWLEAYATIGNTDLPNEMWQTRSEGQLDKCAEAAALRKAFPEELGGEQTAEEMAGRRIIIDHDIDEAPRPALPASGKAAPNPDKPAPNPAQAATAAPQGRKEPEPARAGPAAGASATTARPAGGEARSAPNPNAPPKRDPAPAPAAEDDGPSISDQLAHLKERLAEAVTPEDVEEAYIATDIEPLLESMDGGVAMAKAIKQERLDEIAAREKRLAGKTKADRETAIVEAGGHVESETAGEEGDGSKAEGAPSDEPEPESPIARREREAAEKEAAAKAAKPEPMTDKQKLVADTLAKIRERVEKGATWKEIQPLWKRMANTKEKYGFTVKEWHAFETAVTEAVPD